MEGEKHQQVLSHKPFPKICPSLCRAGRNSYYCKVQTMGFMGKGKRGKKGGSHSCKLSFLQCLKTKSTEYLFFFKQRESRAYNRLQDLASFMAYKSFQNHTHPPRINHIKSRMCCQNQVQYIEWGPGVAARPLLNGVGMC